MLSPDIKQKTVPVTGQTEELIIDYNEEDFREYWETKAKSILDQYENELTREVHQDTRGWFLDLGCGHGRLTPSYYHEEKQIVLVDYAVNHLEMAAEAMDNWSNIHYIAADAYQLPFKNASFKGGVCVRLFHHINQPESFLSEFTRLFSGQSEVLFSFMNKRNLLRLFRHGFRCFRADHSRISRVLFGSHPKYVKEQFEKQQFEILTNRGSGFLHQITHSSPFMERSIEKSPRLFNLGKRIDHSMNNLLGPAGFAVMQYVLLRRMVSKEDGPRQTADSSDLMSILQCPKCLSDQLYEINTFVKCTQCSTSYPRKGQIYDFRIQ